MVSLWKSKCALNSPQNHGAERPLKFLTRPRRFAFKHQNNVWGFDVTHETYGKCPPPIRQRIDVQNCDEGLRGETTSGGVVHLDETSRPFGSRSAVHHVRVSPSEVIPYKRVERALPRTDANVHTYHGMRKFDAATERNILGRTDDIHCALFLPRYVCMC